MRKGAMMAMLAALALPIPAAAQAPPDAAKLKAIETRVPAQAWYPDGYYDIRIAAEAQMAEEPRELKYMVTDWDDGTGKRYDVIDCSADYYSDYADYDAAMIRYSRIAVDVSRIRSELERLGYPLAAYAAPLAKYERALVEEAAKRSDAEVLIDAGLSPPGDDPAAEAAAAAEEAAMADEAAEADVESDWENSPAYILAAEIEANRLRLAPKLPKVVIEGGCGAGEGAPVIVKTSPPGGEVLLANAFAFKVCTRKKADPWDRFACKWNEIETGVEKQLSGRYVYQVKWPDGTVRKGTREIIAGEDGDPASVVTFKKTGS
jgi:hypothetical protein